MGASVIMPRTPGVQGTQVPPSLSVALERDPRVQPGPARLGRVSVQAQRASCAAEGFPPSSLPAWRHLYLDAGDVGTLRGDVSSPAQEGLARNPHLVEHGKSVWRYGRTCGSTGL